MFQKKIFFILFLFYSNSVISQHIVSGQVFDKNNNESLIGANVVVYSNSEVISGSTSDFDGKFSINLPSGEYTFELSYIGYNNIELDTIVDGSLFLGEFFLIESSTFLSDVVISSKQVKNTETAIINLKNKSINSIDAVSSQSINKSGDSNVASVSTPLARLAFSASLSSLKRHVKGAAGRRRRFSNSPWTAVDPGDPQTHRGRGAAPPHKLLSKLRC